MPDMKTWEITFVHTPEQNIGGLSGGSCRVSTHSTVKSLGFFVNDRDDERYVKDVARALDDSPHFQSVRVYKEAEREEVDYS